MKEHLYLLRTYGKGISLLKFGYSSNINNRIQSYKNTNPFIEVLHIWEVEKAKEIEYQFHSNNKSFLKNEWYDENMYDIIVNYVNNPCTYEEKNICKSFKEVVIECEKQDEDYLKWAFNQYPFLETAIKYLGFDKIKELGYNKSHVERYTSKYYNTVESDKIITQLNTYYEIETGVFISNARLKEILDEIHNSLSINKIAKANDIVNYKRVKVKQKMIKGKSTLGYIIL